MQDLPTTTAALLEAIQSVETGRDDVSFSVAACLSISHKKTLLSILVLCQSSCYGDLANVPTEEFNSGFFLLCFESKGNGKWV